jgi:acetylornithine deacetylase/succinyl-diaminopimelate desuccinylase-like protein
MFDARWRENGHMDQALAVLEGWARDHAPPGTSSEVLRLEGRTPLMYLEIPGASEDTVLFYGHVDKQPEMTGWSEGLGPFTPVVRDGRLYGRGSVDDGYALFASLAAINALHQQEIPHARCVIIIESCEESGSYDLPAYMDAFAGRIGSPSLVVCLDSGCGNYEQLWCTTSLRGLIVGTLAVETLTEGVHSGDASGIVPSTFRVLRSLISRLEDENSGVIRPAALHTSIPRSRSDEAGQVASVLGEEVHQMFPWQEGARPVTHDLTGLVLNRTWRPALEVIGADGLPPTVEAGNVLRPRTVAKLSLRLPPTLDAEVALSEVKTLLESDPPYGSRVSFSDCEDANGWDAPAMPAWFQRSLRSASRNYFGKEAVFMGEGGSIPFIAMLAERFPDAQYLVTGAHGPNANAHGPNEFLDLATAKRLTCSVAQVLRDHHLRAS